MLRPIVGLTMLLTAAAAFAQLQPPTRTLRQVADPTMVVIDRGARLEVLPTQRATPRTDGAGRVISHDVVAATATSPIGPRQLGVVFNHSMQQRGFVSGEIAFILKEGQTAAQLDPALYPGLKRFGTPVIYVVNARTPAEFVQLIKRLQARKDVDWVEPIVSYSASSPTPGSSAAATAAGSTSH